MAVDFTPEQRESAATLQSQLNGFLAMVATNKTGLEHTYVEIGDRLATIRAQRYWRLWGFANFSKYMQSLESRTQNYHCLGVARDLLPLVPKDDLVRMGISKASVLRLLVKGGKPVTSELVAMACQRPKQELEGAVAQELGLVKEERGPWFSFGGARMEDSEKEEFLRAVNTVVRAGDLGGEEIINWQEVPSLRKKQILQLLCIEFLATYNYEAEQTSPSGDETGPASTDFQEPEGGSAIGLAA